MNTKGRKVIFEEFGQPEHCLRVEEAEPRPVAPGEVLVRVLASPVNPADINFVQGVYGVKPDLPAVPGMEGCGEVLACPGGAFEAGRRVIFLRKGGAWSTETVVAESELIPVPEGIDPVQAAMLAVNPLTAWCLLRRFGELKGGDWIVQNAANSNVGRCVIQLARDQGINTINLVRRGELCGELRELGGTVVLVDGDEMVGAALEASGGARPRLALNGVGGKSALRQMDLLERRGVHVTYGAMSREILKIPNKFLIFKELTVTGFWVTKWREEAGPEAVREAYRILGERVAQGTLRQAVDRTYPLAEVRAACQRAQEEGRDGKVVLTMI